jgi:stage II sporulation protein AA (anti-sigma F factor antagonist)
VDLREDTVGGVTVVEVKGRIDNTTAPVLAERLMAGLRDARVRVVLDLSRLEYIGSAGFRVLLVAAKHADQTGGRLVLCGISGRISQVFNVGGFLDLFTVAENRAAGIAAAG